MALNGWTRLETLVALNIYCRTTFGRLHARNLEIIEVADRLGRTPSALAMKCCNLAALDGSLQSRGISGLRKTSRLDRQIWAEFEQDPESIAFEAEKARAEIMQQPLRVADVVEWEHIQGIDIAVVTKVRVNQHFFRSLVLSGYRSRCAICDLPIPSLLVAGHIVPWSVDRSLRMNPRNGICLCSLHERAFDKGLITIDTEYSINVNPSVKAAAEVESVAGNFLRFVGRTLNLPDRWLPEPTLLQRHAELIG